MISREEFAGVCNSIIPQEEIMEFKRCRKNVWFSILTMIFGIAAGIFIAINAEIYVGIAISVLSLILGIIFSVKSRYRWNDFKGQYGKEVIAALLKGFTHKYTHDHWIGSWILDACGFVDSSYDDCGGEDMLTINIPNDDGSPSDTTFNICDAWATRTDYYTVTKTDSDGNTYTETESDTVTLYSGCIAYVHFPFKFKCDMSINTDIRGAKKLTTEDIKFNKMLKVYTNNDVEALCILTPTLMQKLKDYRYRNGRIIFTLYEEGSLYFGMDRNLFKLISKRGGPSGKVFARFYDDIYEILAIITEIQNNNKVFNI